MAIRQNVDVFALSIHYTTFPHICKNFCKINVHPDGLTYDAPMQFIGQKVEVRFLPGIPDSVYILYGDSHYPLRLTDRIANGRTKRETPMELDYGRVKEGIHNIH